MTPKNNTPEIVSVVNRMVGKIVDRFNPDRILLFGSYARGEADADSDVDLLVVMPFDGPKRAKRLEIRSVLHGMGVAKDIALVSPEEFDSFRAVKGSIIYQAEHEGQVVYDRAA